MSSETAVEYLPSISVDKVYLPSSLDINGINVLGEPDIVVIGDSGIFEIVVTNNSETTATGIEVIDDLSAELFDAEIGGSRLLIDDVTAERGHLSLAENVIVWNVGHLAPGESVTLTADFSVAVANFNEFALAGTLGSDETDIGGTPTDDIDKYYNQDFSGFFRYTDLELRPEEDGEFDGYNFLAAVGEDLDGDGFGDVVSSVTVTTDQGATDSDTDQLLIAGGAVAFESSVGAPGLGYFSNTYELAEGSHDGRGGGYCRCSPREEFSLNIKWEDERPVESPQDFLNVFIDGALSFEEGSFSLTPDPSDPGSTRVLEVETATAPMAVDTTPGQPTPPTQIPADAIVSDDPDSFINLLNDQDNYLVFTGGDSDRDFNGNGGNDTFLLGDGSQRANMGNGSDTVFAGAGDDLIRDNGGVNNQLFGEEGDDLIIANAGSGVINGGAGFDTIEINGAQGYTVQLELDAGAGLDTFDTIRNVNEQTLRDGGVVFDVLGADAPSVTFERMGNGTKVSLNGDDLLFIDNIQPTQFESLNNAQPLFI